MDLKKYKKIVIAEGIIIGIVGIFIFFILFPWLSLGLPEDFFMNTFRMDDTTISTVAFVSIPLVCSFLWVLLIVIFVILRFKKTTCLIEQ